MLRSHLNFNLQSVVVGFNSTYISHLLHSAQDNFVEPFLRFLLKSWASSVRSAGEGHDMVVVTVKGALGFFVIEERLNLVMDGSWKPIFLNNDSRLYIECNMQ
jgi:hypothetical protein